MPIDGSHQRTSSVATPEALTALIEALGEAVVLVDAGGGVAWASAAAERLTGCTTAELVAGGLAEAFDDAACAALREALARARAFGREGTLPRARGVGGELTLRVVPLPGEGAAVLLRPMAGDPCGDEPAVRAPRHDAVGQLAGGLAHEFNNLLTVIRGNLVFARGGLRPGSAAHEDLVEVERAVGRAAVLVRQLLALGRRQLLRLQPVEARAVVRDALPRLRRRCSPDALLDLVFTTEACVVQADPEQLQQVLVNLVANACEAMPAGGCVTVDTGVVHLEADAAREWSGLAAGPYVRFTVRDTGHGMNETARERAFDPFFTTKPQGAGLGLGLAVAHGIVAQSGGAMRVESAPGHGTAVSVLLPRVADEVADEVAIEAAPEARGGTEALLVAEAVPALRVAIVRLLLARGYVVQPVATAAAALERAYSEPPALLVCGTTLPDAAAGVAAAMRRAHPSLPLLLLARAGDDAEALVAAAAPAAWVLHAPLVSHELLATVRAALDAAGRPSAV